MSPAADATPLAAAASGMECVSLLPKLSHLRSVRWRIFLCNMPSYTFVDLRRVIAGGMLPCGDVFLLIHIFRKMEVHLPVVMDNPLSESPDSIWGRFFRNAELEKLLDQVLSRLYLNMVATSRHLDAQNVLRRILLLWCLRHPKYGYRQGMREILAPLLYVVHADLQQLAEASKLHKDHFTDKFDDASSQQHSLPCNFELMEREDASSQEKTKRIVKLDELDPEIQTIVFLSDPYGAEGELGVVV
ncbi:hypothetical protein V2J09_017768 [Rumex salicifolius]